MSEAEIDRLRRRIAELEAQVVEARKLIGDVAPWFQSYEDCNEDYCQGPGNEQHELRSRLDDWLARTAPKEGADV